MSLSNRLSKERFLMNITIKNPCAFTGCWNPAYGRGLCLADYRRVRRFSNPEDYVSRLAELYFPEWINGSNYVPRQRSLCVNNACTASIVPVVPRPLKGVRLYVPPIGPEKSFTDFLCQACFRAVIDLTNENPVSSLTPSPEAIVSDEHPNAWSDGIVAFVEFWDGVKNGSIPPLKRFRASNAPIRTDLGVAVLYAPPKRFQQLEIGA